MGISGGIVMEGAPGELRVETTGEEEGEEKHHMSKEG